MLRRVKSYVTGRRDAMDGTRPVLKDTEARQGPSGRPVFYVLIASGGLLALYLIVMMIWSFADAPIAPRHEAGQVDPPVVPSSSLNAEDPPAANPAYPVPAVPRVD